MGTKVVALKTVDGSEIWTKQLPDDIYRSSPAVSEELVIIGCRDHKVYALDKLDGTVKWSFITAGYVDTSPVFENGIAYVASEVREHGEFTNFPNSRVYALNINDGSLVWQVTLDQGVYENSPALYGGRIFIGTSAGILYGIRITDGQIDWANAVVGSGSGIYSSAAISGGIVYIGSNNNKMYGIDCSTGSVVWEYTTGGIIRNAPAIAVGRLFFASSDGKMYSFLMR